MDFSEHVRTITDQLILITFIPYLSHFCVYENEPKMPSGIDYDKTQNISGRKII